MPRSMRLSRKHSLVLLGIASVAFFVALSVIERRLSEEGGPSIVEFEFVASAARATQMLAEWGSDGRELARLSLWVDFGFMASYGAFVALAAVATRDFGRDRGLRRLAAAGVVVPALAISAALFDAAENTALLLILGGHGGAAAPPLATVCASVKFLLITVSIGYVLWGLVSRFRAGPSRPGVVG